MDDHTKFLLERLDRHRDEIRDEISGVEKRITTVLKQNSKRIQDLEIWRAKLMGMAIFAGGFGSWIIKKLGV